MSIQEAYNNIVTSTPDSVDVTINWKLVEKNLPLVYVANGLLDCLYSDTTIVSPDKKGWGYHIKNKQKFKQYKSAIAEYINNIL